MSQKIRIKAGNVQIDGELNDSATAELVAGALPITGKVQKWGGEIYFPIMVRAELEPTGREIVEPGELGYWPTGRAFCIFFGPTPVSDGDEIRAASAVNIFGAVKGDFSGLWDVPKGADIVVEAL